MATRRPRSYVPISRPGPGVIFWLIALIAWWSISIAVVALWPWEEETRDDSSAPGETQYDPRFFDAERVSVTGADGGPFVAGMK